MDTDPTPYLHHRPRHLVAVDPGKHHAGLAIFDLDRNQLAYATTLRPGERYAPERTASAVLARVGTFRSVHSERNALRWVVEDQVDYRDHPGRSEDLDALRDVVRALRVGAMGVGYVAAWVSVRPSVWKGQVPKQVHHARLAALLEEGERVRAPGGRRGDSGDAPDTWDAIGLGLWALGRAGRGGTRPT